jgi:hypothetical protein
VTQTFNRAIERDKRYEKSHTPRRVVVFVDEAGLADQARELTSRGDKGERKMVLKALHPFLDGCQVASVCISNSAFDAANANRMVTLLRSKQELADLRVLARGVLGYKGAESSIREDCIVEGLCLGYMGLQQDAHTYTLSYHDRDLIYTLRHLNRHSAGARAEVTPRALLHALEENFNGVPHGEFRRVVDTFFCHVAAQLGEVDESWTFAVPEDDRDTMEIIRAHLYDQPARGKAEAHQLKPRFVLLIDPSDDDSAIRLLQAWEVLGGADSHVLHVSPFAGDSEPGKHSPRYISQVKLLMETGAKVLKVNAESILGSFYDL